MDLDHCRLEITEEDIKKLCNNKDMILERNRLETFNSWPHKEDVACSAPNVAKAGFYKVIDEMDTVVCFFCEKKLEGWLESDDPWEEHRTHSPQCKFVILGKPEEELTYLELHTLADELMLTGVINLLQKRQQLLMKQYCDNLQSLREL